MASVSLHYAVIFDLLRVARILSRQGEDADVV
jgi:hypothetical protein